MKVELMNYQCKVTREEGDKPIYKESLFYYKVKEELIKQGYDVIKKLMWKDGHLYGDSTLPYIRSRNMGKKFQDTFEWFQIYDNDYAIRSITEHYREYGDVTLWVDRGGDKK